MSRDEVFIKIRDARKDFEILDNRANSLFKNEGDIIRKITRDNNTFKLSETEDSNNYGVHCISDITEAIQLTKVNLNVLETNTDKMMTFELEEYVTEIYKELKSSYEKLKKIKINLKEAYYSEQIKQKIKLN